MKTKINAEERGIKQARKNAELNKRGRTRNLFLFSCFLVFLFSCFLGVSINAAKAASIYLSPSSGSHKVGDNFSVGVYVSSADQALNAFSGSISFPTDKLQITGISKSGSIASLWVKEPSYSASSASFEGIVLNPGFKGSGGKIISLSFKVKAAGSAVVSLSSGSVLANDGNGTEILSGLGKATLTLTAAEEKKPEEQKPTEEIKPATGAPVAPQITSSTHSDQNRWYSLKDAQLSWNLSSDITSVKYSWDNNPSGKPTVTDGRLAAKTITGLTDGVWYYHLQFKNSISFGPVSTYKLQVDTEKPDHLAIKEIERKDLTEPKAKFFFEASDKLSGISRYTIKIDELAIIAWAEDKSSVKFFETPILDPGKHQMNVRAFDAADNYIESAAEFEVKALMAPTITEIPDQLNLGEVLSVKGKTYPNIDVNLHLQKDELKTITAKSDADGNFSITSDEKFPQGVYQLWLDVVDGRGAKSDPTSKLTLVIKSSILSQYGTQTVKALSVIVPLVALVSLLIFILWYSWYRFLILKKKLRKEAMEADRALHKAFDTLRDDVRDEIRNLERASHRRQLTDEEERIIRRLRKDMDDAEKMVKKEIRDIEREVEE